MIHRRKYVLQDIFQFKGKITVVVRMGEGVDVALPS